MKTFPLRIKLLNHLFNYAYASNEGAVTAEFIGDIALAYALNRVLKQENFYAEHRWQPEYKELARLDYCFTVARPVHMNHTGVYVRNTQFGCDGGPDYDILGDWGRFPTGRKLFKNFWKVQGIAAGSEFSCWLICKDDFRLPSPCTIRLGTHRECLALVEEDKNADPSDLWLNAYSLREILGGQTLDRFITCGIRYSVEFKLEHYILLKHLPLEQVVHIFSDQFLQHPHG